ncbi:MAG: SH3 domain-containing protein [Calditrichaeota bacterium]|nr:SH3 domain-containing protein [Calditrichota bacterium]
MSRAAFFLCLCLLFSGNSVAQEPAVAVDTLWAIPCGPVVGTMAAGARVQVLDTVAGWAKVSVEGWVPIGIALQYLQQDTVLTLDSTPEAEEIRQCEAITLKGTQCSRRAMKGSHYCWQHQTHEKRKK